MRLPPSNQRRDESRRFTLSPQWAALNVGQGLDFEIMQPNFSLCGPPPAGVRRRWPGDQLRKEPGAAACPGGCQRRFPLHHRAHSTDPHAHAGDQLEVFGEPNVHVVSAVTRNANFCNVRLLLKVFTSELAEMDALECVKFGFLLLQV